MDRMVHTALNSLKMILQNQQITSQNISNASVVGYRRDSNSEFGTAYLNSEEGLNTKVFATREIGAFSTQQGDLESTENPLDVAIKGEGYFIIQPKEGEVALSRRGDFKIDVQGQLVNGEGSLVLGEDLQPIVLPAFNAIQISSDGLINIRPIDAPADAPFQLAATLGTTTAEELELEKDLLYILRQEFHQKTVNVKRVLPKGNRHFLQDRPHLFSTGRNAFSLRKTAIFFKIAPI